MEIRYSNSGEKIHYFKTANINGLLCLKGDYIGDNVKDIKKLSYNGKIQVGLFLKINGLFGGNNISKIAEELDIDKRIYRLKLSDLSNSELAKVLILKLLSSKNRIIILRGIEAYFPLRDFKIFMQKIINYVEKSKQMIIYETNNIDVLTDICNSITVYDGENVIFSSDDYKRLPIKTNLMKIADLANERDAKLDYYKDVNDLLKAIYRSVSDENR